MNSSDLPSGFVENWLSKLRDKYPDSETIAAVSDATKLERLDEAKLLKRLRELSKPAKKEKLNDQG